MTELELAQERKVDSSMRLCCERCGSLFEPGTKIESQIRAVDRLSGLTSSDIATISILSTTGATDAEIGIRLFLGTRTIQNKMGTLFKVFGVKNRVQLVVEFSRLTRHINTVCGACPPPSRRR